MRKCSSARLSALSDDPFLDPYLATIRRRAAHVIERERILTGNRQELADFACGHGYFGLHHQNGRWVFREWAPCAEKLCLIGTFSSWQESEQFALGRLGASDQWEVCLPENALRHGDLYRLRIHWPGGEGDRIPAYARRVVQDEETKIFSAQVWHPDQPYAWQYPCPQRPSVPLIYEAHVGMAQEREAVGTYQEFKNNVLPRIVDSGYNTLQLMALLEHPYYASFGYQVSSFFAASSRFGTPEELKALVDEAHGAGLSVLMDLVHSHAAPNEAEGLSRFDGSLYQYFHDKERGCHPAWGSRCFNYEKPEVLHFLLSNCRFWLDEYRLDGFRFDGVTSMLYLHHGLGTAFTSYDDYFGDAVDRDALTYLTLANRLIHAVKPSAITIAEDVSGMPGLAAPVEDGGCGFDYRLAMGVPDCWFKLVNDVRDEDWNMGFLWHELTNRRAEERTISYAESHDQALVGGKTLMFELVGASMYEHMHALDRNLDVERGMALHKMIRLATLASAGHGYLNFMGNEFGHPEWIDFPREGNNWSYRYARRQWRLRDDLSLKYHFIADFDKTMLHVMKEHGVLEHTAPRLVLVREDDRVLVFERADLLFLFNFHPSRSLADYAFEAPPGEYVLELDTDEGRFGGQERLQPGQHFSTHGTKEAEPPCHRLQVYLPCRTAMVLRRA